MRRDTAPQARRTRFRPAIALLGGLAIAMVAATAVDAAAQWLKSWSEWVRDTAVGCSTVFYIQTGVPPLIFGASYALIDRRGNVLTPLTAMLVVTGGALFGVRRYAATAFAGAGLSGLVRVIAPCCVWMVACGVGFGGVRQLLRRRAAAQAKRANSDT